MNLLYVNARKRRRKGTRRARSASGRFVKRHTTRRRRRSRTMRRTHRRSHRVHTVTRRRRRYGARRVHRRHRRHNPSGIRLSLGSIFGEVRGALTGAAGAVVVDFLQAKVPLPATLNQGRMRYVTSFAYAILLGMLGRRFLPGFAGPMARGSMTVTAYKAVQDFFPMLSPIQMAGLGGFGYVAPAMDAGSYRDSTVGMLTAGNDSLSEYVSGLNEYVS